MRFKQIIQTEYILGINARMVQNFTIFLSHCREMFILQITLHPGGCRMKNYIRRDTRQDFLNGRKLRRTVSKGRPSFNHSQFGPFLAREISLRHKVLRIIRNCSPPAFQRNRMKNARYARNATAINFYAINSHPSDSRETGATMTDYFIKIQYVFWPLRERDLDSRRVY